jgi:hypothetical protein
VIWKEAAKERYRADETEDQVWSGPQKSLSITNRLSINLQNAKTRDQFARSGTPPPYEIYLIKQREQKPYEEIENRKRMSCWHPETQQADRTQYESVQQQGGTTRPETCVLNWFEWPTYFLVDSFCWHNSPLQVFKPELI